VLKRMRRRNIRHYTTAIKACSVGGQCPKCLELLAALRDEGLRPDTVTYNSESVHGVGEDYHL
jgi:pentatricopeptide repeat protein